MMRYLAWVLSAALLASPAYSQCDPCAYPKALECREAPVKNPPQRRTWDKELGTKLYFKALEERRELTPWYLLTRSFDIRALGYAEGLLGIDVRVRKSGLWHVELEMLFDRDSDFMTIEEKYLFSGSFFEARDMFEKDLRRIMNEAKTADDPVAYFTERFSKLPHVSVQPVAEGDHAQYVTDIDTLLSQMCDPGKDSEKNTTE